MSKLPCPLPSSEHSAMLQAFEKRYWELEKEDIPSETLVELRLNPLVKGKFTAEPLTKVTADQDAEETTPELT